jgi:hypothetical protein
MAVSHSCDAGSADEASIAFTRRFRQPGEAGQRSRLDHVQQHRDDKEYRGEHHQTPGCPLTWNLALDAVTNGLAMPWSSGPVEGRVNHIKMIKRQMFGRAGLPLLRKRVLLTAQN